MAYALDNLPIRDYFAVTGHCVRTVCMFAGMTDIAKMKGDQEHLLALEQLCGNR